MLDDDSCAIEPVIVIVLGWISNREPREGPMRFQQISQRGKQYLKTAETLLRAAQTMTDRAIASQLKALAEDYERRAEKASHVDAAKALARSAANADEMVDMA